MGAGAEPGGADAAIVGKFVGKNALAAVGGTTSMVIGLFIGFFVSLSSGFAVIIAQSLSSERFENVNQ